MAERIHPPDGFERQFSNPLWKTLRLDINMFDGFTSLVEGNRHGYSYMVADLQHEYAGLFSMQHVKVETSFFIVRLPRRAPGWKITRSPAGFAVHADDAHVYLARVGKRPRVAEWPDILDEAIAVAKSLKPLSAPEAARQAEAPVPNIQDKRWILLWGILAAFIPFFLLPWFAYEFSSLLRNGYVLRCESGSEYGQVLTGLAAWPYVAGLGASIPGLAVMFWVIARFYNRRGFPWRISLAGLLTAALTWGGFALAFNVPVWKGQFDDGRRVSCQASDTTRTK